MPTPEELRQRRDVDPDDVDDLIEIATELHELARAQEARATVGEVEDVARELELPAHLVEEAIVELQRRRDAAAAEAARARAAADARAAGVRRALLGLAVVAVVTLGAFATRVAAVAIQLGGRASEVAAAEANLRTVLDRQASLMPQLLALSGGDPGALTGRLDAYRDAPSLDAAVRAADDLGLAMASALAALPPPEGEVAARQREELRYELSGVANRVATEQRRYRQAVVAWREVADGPAATAAIALGFASSPPGVVPAP